MTVTTTESQGFRKGEIVTSPISGERRLVLGVDADVIIYERVGVALSDPGRPSRTTVEKMSAWMRGDEGETVVYRSRLRAK